MPGLPTRRQAAAKLARRAAGRATSRYISSAAADAPATIIPIGAAVYSPAIPTSGAATAPTTYCVTPSSAEALPAVRPCPAIASAVLFG